MEFKLRPWTINDLESVSKNADNESITKFMSDGFPDCKNKWASFISFATSEESILYLAIEINGEAAGGIGIRQQKDIMRKNAELGYWLSEPYWGLGIMTRTIKEIVERAFDTFDIDRIYATPFETNIASHRILEKAGFTLEARLQKVVIKNNERLDELIYAIRKMKM